MAYLPCRGLSLYFLSIGITILNVYARNRTSKYMKQKLIKMNGEIDKFIVKVEDINIHFSAIPIGNQQKISKYTDDLNKTIN